MKYYAVRKGRNVGIYESWSDCEKNVKGYSGQEYKSFTNKNDAEKYMNNNNNDNNNNNNNNNDNNNKNNNNNNIYETTNIEVKEKGTNNSIIIMENENQEKNEKYNAYVDGSYNDKIKEYGSGGVIYNNKKEYKFSFSGKESDLVGMRNVAGEIKAAEYAMQYALNNGCKELDLYYDYKGIEYWCTGSWKANKIGTIKYRDFYKQIENKIKVNFIWVESHSNDYYNDMADELAKKSVGL